MNALPPLSGPPHAAPPTSGLAIASLVCGILGWSLLPMLGSLAAIITGHMARAEIRRNPAGQGGDGLAVAGLVLGWSAVLLGIAVVLFLLAVLFGGIGLMAWMR